MCTDYRRMKGYDEIDRDFSETRIPLRFPQRYQAPNLRPQAEVRPTVPAVVFRRRDDGVELVEMRWGLIPFFYKGPIKGWKAATFNARAEGVKTAPSFREAFKRRRCLIAAEGWVEWKGEGKPKPKFYVEPRGGEPICFAGLLGSCADGGRGRGRELHHGHAAPRRAERSSRSRAGGTPPRVVGTLAGRRR